MKRVLVLNGHPDPDPGKLAHALARAYREGAQEAGCVVRHIDVGGMDFPLLRKAEEFETVSSQEAIIRGQDAFLTADHIVILYPLWLGGPPALLKGYMEQVARANFFLGKTERGFPSGRLKGRSARVIVTMGMPALVYRLWYGAHGVKAFNRSILNLAGIRPVRTTVFGGIGAKPDRCAAMMEKVRELGRRVA